MPIVTPVDTASVLFGKNLAIFKEDGEFIYVELKDGIHWIEARFTRAQVKPVTIPVAPAPIPATPAAS